MSNHLSIARPYALAAFDYARDSQQLAAWKSFLEAAAYMSREPSIARLLTNPEFSTARLYDLFHEVLASVTDDKRKNFLRLLTQNRRLTVLPEISGLFNASLAALEKISNVRVVTAVEAQHDFQQKLANALSKRIQHEVTLHCEVDPALIGGAVVYIGDRVIDGSVRGKLSRLLENLTG